MKSLSSPIWKLGLPLIAVVMVLGLAGLAHAQHHGSRPGGERPDREEMINRMISHLGLSDEQQEQMKQIHLQHGEQTEALHEQLNAAREHVDALVDAESFDEAAIREAAGELSALQTDAFVSRAKMQREIREILTPEQFEQLKKMRDRHQGMMMGQPGGDKHSRPHQGGHRAAPEDS